MVRSDNNTNLTALPLADKIAYIKSLTPAIAPTYNTTLLDIFSTKTYPNVETATGILETIPYYINKTYTRLENLMEDRTIFSTDPVTLQKTLDRYISTDLQDVKSTTASLLNTNLLDPDYTLTPVVVRPKSINNAIEIYEAKDNDRFLDLVTRFLDLAEDLPNQVNLLLNQAEQLLSDAEQEDYNDITNKLSNVLPETTPVELSTREENLVAKVKLVSDLIATLRDLSTHTNLVCRAGKLVTPKVAETLINEYITHISTT